ncbi:MAG: hypothetical protein LBD93_00685 [Treponema sp.]|jgi:hypothetical protein|nr:hypothetical protein [Treponema sp.]
MALINPVNPMLHRIRVKLYPNYLPRFSGGYIVRTDSEAAYQLGYRGGGIGSYAT